MAKQLAEVLRAVPHALREDLWTRAAEPPPRWQQRSQDWIPAILVLLVVAAAVLLAGSSNQYAFAYHLGVPIGLLLGGIQSAAVVGALFRPVVAWWATTLVTLLTACTTHAPSGSNALFPWTGPGLTAQVAVLFLLALRTRPRVAAETLAITLLLGVGCARFLGQDQQHTLTPSIAFLTVAVVVGGLLRGRRLARRQLVEQEELTAEERARRTLLEERSRIARELHDVVAHHMSVISIQAQVAVHLAENPSAELRENLAGIRQNAVEALTELRRVLGVLRSEDTPSDGVRHAPQPTLDRLDELVGNVRGAGLTVTTETVGAPRPLPPGIELSAFRIAQEALSNAMRHAPGATVRVEVGYHPSGVTVRVTNTAPEQPAPPSPGAGHGLLGMRERTAMLGGELATGATPDGGYEVTAILPTPPPAEPAAPAAPTVPVEDTP
ncbi:sensor histidine kinase [Kitasatospora kazusensis]|uniref:histidine kinase n=1 Tax=Kitasatospora kazusensis TaxID=407974 RepID=A0ABN2YZU6_9ACTN